MRKVTDRQFVEAWQACGGRGADVAKALDINIRAVYARRNSIEAKGAHLPSAGDNNNAGRGDAGALPYNYNPRLTIDGFAGRMVVFSDAHYYPGIGSTTAHRALIEVIKENKPKLIVGNGDIFDGARLSRYPRNGWEEQPRVTDEIDEVRERMAEIRHAYRGAQLARTVGNHDIRLDRFLAMNASDFEGVQGFRLSDHLAEWKETVSLFINGNCMVKHRITGGVHSAYRNTVAAGTSTVTGHTHLLEVKPHGDYRGRRYGVSTGALADIDSPAFAYTEDSPVAWCSGFAVLTFDSSGRLLMPELAEVIDKRCYFRGQVVIDDNKKARKNARIAA